jgi:hypothetical protein
MHSLALRILRSAAVPATLYPSDPIVLDDWETENVYDQELATAVGCTPRARGRGRIDPGQLVKVFAVLLLSCTTSRRRAVALQRLAALKQIAARIVTNLI